jgi:8-oxo-dGTP pyrophosphatase MutT (NUDIX family)
MPRVFESPVLSVETFEVHAGGRTQERVRLHAADWVIVVPITEMGEVILVEQHRSGTDALSLEPPGGRVDPGESELDAAKRELLEETGYGGGTWEPLGCVRPDAALFSNTLWLFAAHDVVPVAPPVADPFERITVKRHGVDDLKQLLVSGAIHHGPAVIAVQRVLLVEQALEQAAGFDDAFDGGE